MEEVIELKNTYDKIYSPPTSQNQELRTIINAYRSEMKQINHEIESGIGETYRELASKGIPAYYWMLEAIHRTSKKAQTKRSFSYVVGILRNWTLYGFGNTRTNEENELFDYFMEITGSNVSLESRQALVSAMSKFGVLKLIRLMPELKEVDVSLFYSQYLTRLLEQRYGASEVRKVVEAPHETIHLTNENIKSVQKSTKLNADNKLKKASKLSDKKALLLLEIQGYLEKNGESKAKDIILYLQNIGFIDITTKNFTAKIQSFKNHSTNLTSKRFGYYVWNK